MSNKNPWSKGKNKIDFPQLGRGGAKKGNIPWNKGIKYSEDMRIIAINNLKYGMKGKKVSEETKIKMSIAQKGKRNGERNSPKTEFKKGATPWIKNKNKTDYPQLSNSGTKNPLRGAKSNLWKGGITPLYVLIRELPESKKWRNLIFERDNYTCMKCFRNGIYLEAHHKKPFAQILKEFIQMNSMFSPIEDKEILLRISLFYPEFWDINNGETLCKDCHDLTKKQNFLRIQ